MTEKVGARRITKKKKNPTDPCHFHFYLATVYLSDNFYTDELC